MVESCNRRNKRIKKKIMGIPKWPNWRHLNEISVEPRPYKFVHGLLWMKLASRIWHRWSTFMQMLHRWYFLMICYIDDMFINEIDAEHFSKCLKSKHPNINFTMEKETNKFLPFVPNSKWFYYRQSLKCGALHWRLCFAEGSVTFYIQLLRSKSCNHVLAYVVHMILIAQISLFIWIILVKYYSNNI